MSVNPLLRTKRIQPQSLAAVLARMLVMALLCTAVLLGPVMVVPLSEAVVWAFVLIFAISATLSFSTVVSLAAFAVIVILRTRPFLQSRPYFLPPCAQQRRGYQEHRKYNTQCAARHHRGEKISGHPANTAETG